MIREHLSLYRQMALVALVAAAGAGTASGAARAPDRAQWMRGGYGVMVHWLFPSEGDVDRWTDRFDLAAFLADFDRTGADWLIFTAGQCRGAYASPNATLDRYCGPGHTSRRDLVREIARAVKSRGKRFVVYSAVDFMKDGCKDHAMQRGLCWDPASSDRTEFQRRWPAVLAEWSRRLGRDCDGWWLDGCAPKEYPKGVDWQAWLDACRAGNADAAVAFNGGVHTFAVRWGASDFEAGEAAALSAVEADLALPRECPGLQRHYLFPVDGYWGAFWPWPKGDWARTQELQKTRPELFDGEKMAARLEARDFPEPICGADRLGRILERAARINAAVTVNVGISPEGRLNPKSVELLRRAADAHAIPHCFTN